MTKKDPVPFSLELPLVDFETITSRAAAFAAPDGSLPLLASVRLFELGGRLAAIASDRYRIGLALAPEGIEAPKGFAVLISASSLRDLARVTKGPARGRDSLGIHLTHHRPVGAQHTLDVRVAALPGLGDVALTLPVHDEAGAPYPDLFRLLREALTRSADAEPNGYNPQFLASFAKGVGRNVPLTITNTGKNLPTIVESLEHDFIGLLVPVRTEGASAVATSPLRALIAATKEH
jgi:hypothetical protein